MTQSWCSGSENVTFEGFQRAKSVEIRRVCCFGATFLSGFFVKQFIEPFVKPFVNAVAMPGEAYWLRDCREPQSKNCDVYRPGSDVIRPSVDVLRAGSDKFRPLSTTVTCTVPMSLYNCDTSS